MADKTNWKNLENYDYLGAYSLDGIAPEIVVTIKKVSQKEVTGEGGIKAAKIIAEFEESKVDGVVIKPMILCKTNCKTIVKIYNSDFIEDWIGKKITIFPTTTRFGRETKPCLRIRPEAPKEEIFNCEVCGKEIPKKLYLQMKNAYGAGLCSAECKEKFLATKNEENKGD